MIHVTRVVFIFHFAWPRRGGRFFSVTLDMRIALLSSIRTINTLQKYGMFSQYLLVLL